MRFNSKSLIHHLVRTLLAAARSLEESTRESRRLVRHAAQSMVEYAIIAALVAVVALVAVKALGSSVSTAFDTITKSVDNANSAGGGTAP